MKVVLFCGGLGMRLRESDDSIPKPLVRIGYMPILWHVMKYYAHFGHKDFILCLGYKADATKAYFLSYNECIAEDFVFSKGGRHLECLNSHIDDWRITFVDTGVYSSIGQRLRAVRKYLEDDEFFLANYSDGLTDLHLPLLIDYAAQQRTLATFLSVRPNLSYHFVSAGASGVVKAIRDVQGSNLRINGGYYAFRQGIFDYLADNDDLVPDCFERLIRDSQLSAYPYDGFWAAMDTFKDKQQLEDLYARGDARWEVWRRPRPAIVGSRRAG